MGNITDFLVFNDKEQQCEHSIYRRVKVKTDIISWIDIRKERDVFWNLHIQAICTCSSQLIIIWQWFVSKSMLCEGQVFWKHLWYALFSGADVTNHACIIQPFAVYWSNRRDVTLCFVTTCTAAASTTCWTLVSHVLPQPMIKWYYCGFSFVTSISYKDLWLWLASSICVIHSSIVQRKNFNFT